MTSLRTSHDACTGYDLVRTPPGHDTLLLGYEIESQYLDSVVEDILFDEAIEVSFRRTCVVRFSSIYIRIAVQMLSLCG